jgi:predicted transcriptional regulator
MLYIISTEHEMGKKNNEKGNLFESLMSKLLDKLGWKITSIDKNVMKAGIEIDLIATSKTYTNQRLIAQCKAYRKPIERNVLSDFWGQIEPEIAKSRSKGENLGGIFLSTSELNGAAKGYFKESFADIADRKNILKVYAADELIEQLLGNGCISTKAAEIGQHLPEKIRNLQAGEKRLLYTKLGYYWLLLLNSKERFSPVGYLLLDEAGKTLDLKASNPLPNALRQEFFDIKDLTCLNNTSVFTSLVSSITPIPKSKSFFDYKYPADPQFFVGREDKIKEAISFISEVQKKKTALRGMVIAANSGIGKSSFILKLKDLCISEHMYFFDIDTRSCDKSDFILRVLEYVIKKLIEMDPKKFSKLTEVKIEGLYSIGKTYQSIDSCLSEGELIIIFLDQFENVYFSKENFDILRQALLQLNYENPKILFGFAWKTDIFLELDIEDELDPKEEIIRYSRIIKLERFKIEESRKILDEIKTESGVKFSKLFIDYLREQSQGYPLLFKKFGYHIIKELTKNYSQEELVAKGLNLKELFEEDLIGLSDEEVTLLKKWANFFPCEIGELCREQDESEAKRKLRKLIEKNLVLEIGSKYDAYCDLFREYLITGRVPFDELFILNSAPKSVIELFFIATKKKHVTLEELIKITKKEKGTLYNNIRDLKTLELITYSRNKITPSIGAHNEEELKTYLREKLLHNTCFRFLLEKVQSQQPILLDSLINTVQEQFFPSVTRQRKTWKVYLRNFARWLEFVDLLRYGNGCIYPVSYTGQVVNFYPENILPQGFVAPLIELLQEIAKKRDSTKTVLQKTLNKAKQTIEKSLTDGTRLAFLARDKRGVYSLTKEGRLFIESSRWVHGEIFREKILEKYVIIKNYIEYLKNSKCLLNDQTESFKKVVPVTGWSDMTLKTYIRTVNNWCAFSGLIMHKGGKIMLKAKNPELSLFN